MSNIKIGARVVCVDDSLQHNTNLKKGREYIVYAIKEGCCEQLVDVGLYYQDNSNNVTMCFTCKKLRKKDMSTPFLRISRFRKVEEKTNYVKLEVKVQEPCLN